MGLSWRTRLPFFYGWLVVASFFVALTISQGIYYSFTVFFVALLEEYGWGRAATAGVFSVFVLVSSFGGVVAGALVDRFGPRSATAVGAILLAVGTAACSQLTELWEFYLYFGVVCGLGTALAGWVPCVAVVSRWFTNRRAAATGIASAGIGLGIVTVVPLCQFIISSAGWRSAYLVLAALSLLGIMPHALMLQVGRPEELGLKPDGTAATRPAGLTAMARRGRRLLVVNERWASCSWSVGMAVRTMPFWLLSVCFLLYPVTSQMLWVHQVAYLVDGGYDKMVAASVVGLAGFVSIPGKILWGMVGDRLGRETTFSMGICCIVVAILLLILTRTFPGVWLVLLFAVAFSVGYSVTAPLGPAAAADIFAGRQFGAIYGVLHVAIGVGSAFGAWLGGYVFDATGSYLVAFAVAVACSTVSAACIWLAAPRKVRRMVREEARSFPS